MLSPLFSPTAGMAVGGLTLRWALQKHSPRHSRGCSPAPVVWNLLGFAVVPPGLAEQGAQSLFRKSWVNSGPKSNLGPGMHKKRVRKHSVAVVDGC